MSVQHTTQQGLTIVSISGELTLVTASQLKKRLFELTEDGATHLIIDLQQVPFIDSTGLGALVSGLKNAKLKGGNLVLAALQEQARSIFEITMAYRIFDLYESVSEAQRQMSA